MRDVLSFLVFLGLAIACFGYTLLQLKSGVSLQWTLTGKRVSKSNTPLLFWANVAGSGLAGLFALIVSILLTRT